MSSKATTPVSPTSTGKQVDASHYACQPHHPSPSAMRHAEEHGIGSGVYYKQTDTRGRQAKKEK